MPPENKVEFDSEKIDTRNRPKKFLYSRIEPSNIEPALIQFLLRKHIIKSERQGDIILVSLFFLCIIFSIAVYIYASSAGANHVTNTAVLKAITRQ